MHPCLRHTLAAGVLSVALAAPASGNDLRTVTSEAELAACFSDALGNERARICVVAGAGPLLLPDGVVLDYSGQTDFDLLELDCRGQTLQATGTASGTAPIVLLKGPFGATPPAALEHAVVRIRSCRLEDARTGSHTARGFDFTKNHVNVDLEDNQIHLSGAADEGIVYESYGGAWSLDFTGNQISTPGTHIRITKFNERRGDRIAFNHLTGSGRCYELAADAFFGSTTSATTQLLANRLSGCGGVKLDGARAISSNEVWDGLAPPPLAAPWLVLGSTAPECPSCSTIFEALNLTIARWPAGGATFAELQRFDSLRITGTFANADATGLGDDLQCGGFMGGGGIVFHGPSSPSGGRADRLEVDLRTPLDAGGAPCAALPVWFSPEAKAVLSQSPGASGTVRARGAEFRITAGSVFEPGVPFAPPTPGHGLAVWAEEGASGSRACASQRRACAAAFPWRLATEVGCADSTGLRVVRCQ